MKNRLNKIGLSLALGCLVVSARAQSLPEYVTKSASGSTSCEVFFPAIPDRQVRIVTAIATSDKAASVLSFRSGSTPYSVSAATAAGTNVVIAYTNGLAPSDVIAGQQSGTNWSAVIHSFPASTNVAVTSTINATTVGSEVYKMSAATTIKVAATTAVYSGQAIYVGARGRPVRVVLDGTSACSLDAISALYE